MKSTHRNQSLRKVIGFALFISLVIVLLHAVTYFAMICRSTGQDIAGLQAVRDELQVIAKRLETDTNQAYRDKRVVLNLLRLCRTAEDIPDLQSDRIVARNQGPEMLSMYVPEGSHTLEISISWKPESMMDTAAQTEAPEPAHAGEKTWSVSLLPACAYILKLVTHRKDGPIQWELTSNHPEFTTRTEMVPLDDFSHRGTSWSGSEVVQFPNQIDRLSIGKLKTAPKAPPGVNLTSATLRGPRHDQQYEITYNVRLLSDGPACVSASDAQRIIIMNREELLQPYEGGGKYELRAPDDAAAATE